MATSDDKAKAPAPKARAGFSPEGKPYPGVDPETGERKAVTLDGLKAEFGSKRGEQVYVEIAQAAGVGVRADRVEEYAPDISLASAGKEVHEKVDAILTAKE